MGTTQQTPLTQIRTEAKLPLRTHYSTIENKGDEPTRIIDKRTKKNLFMMIRIVIVLLMFAANASAQNWKEISKAVAIEHKKLLGEAE